MKATTARCEAMVADAYAHSLFQALAQRPGSASSLSLLPHEWRLR